MLGVPISKKKKKSKGNEDTLGIVGYVCFLDW